MSASNMQEYALLRTIFLEGPAPCDGCPMWRVCADHRLACLDFERYVETGRCNRENRFATRSRYNGLFPKDHWGYSESSAAPTGESDPQTG